MGTFLSLPLPLAQVGGRDGHARGESGPRPPLIPHRDECSMYTRGTDDGCGDCGGGGPPLLLKPRHEVRCGCKVRWGDGALHLHHLSVNGGCRAYTWEAQCNG